MNKYINIVLFTTLIFFSGCSSMELNRETSNTEHSQISLTDTHWYLISLEGKRITQEKSEGRYPHLILKDGKAHGNSGCNGYGASYILKENRLSFSTKGFVMTRMFCKGSVETQFIKALQSVKTYMIEDDYLNLYDENAKLLARFTSQG